MSNFTPLVSKDYEFEGDSVHVSFSRLKRKHMLNAIPAFKAVADAEEAGDDEAKLEAMNDFLGGIIDVIPEYVNRFEGLSDTAGNEVSITTVVNEFYFMKLASQICMDIVKESSPTLSEEEKEENQ